MRRILGIVGVCLLASLGCKHVGGKCDCGPSPGDAATYAPYAGGTVKTIETAAPAPIVVNPAVKK